MRTLHFKTLDVLIIADSKLPIPPRGYGGLERVVAYLAEGLAARGHRVTLIGHPKSSIPGRVVGYPFAGRRPRPIRAAIRFGFAALFERELRRRPDVVLSTCRIDYLTRLRSHRVPLVYNFQNPIAPGQAEALRRLDVADMRIVALTRAHAAPLGDALDVKIIGNCVDVDRLTFSHAPGEGYLAFLGRLTHNKGVDTAIRVARRTGLPLRLAGNISDEEGGREFFETEVRPQLDDQVRWVGEITDADKPAFLGNACALLVPIRWEEPFGIVVPEALACGTPVIASPRGSMPELISSGENGFLASTDEEFAQAITRLPTVDRARCRADAEKRFSREFMIEQYLKVIREVVS